MFRIEHPRPEVIKWKHVPLDSSVFGEWVVFSIWHLPSLITVFKLVSSLLFFLLIPLWLYCCCCSVAQPCLTLCDPTDYSMPGFPVLHHPLELAQTHVHWVGDAVQWSHLLLSPSPLAFNLSQNQGLFYFFISIYVRILGFKLQFVWWEDWALNLVSEKTIWW